jgi:hypothetical protein
MSSDNAPVPADGFTSKVLEARKSISKIYDENTENCKSKTKTKSDSPTKNIVPSITSSPIKHANTLMSQLAPGSPTKSLHKKR